jgi:hypothetical protein
VENRECRLIFLLKRAGKQKARKLNKKVEPIPEMGNERQMQKVRGRARSMPELKNISCLKVHFNLYRDEQRHVTEAISDS